MGFNTGESGLWALTRERLGQVHGAVEKGHKMIKTRKMKNFDKEAFLADVSGICWEQMFSETDDINALVNYWSSLFSLIIDKHAPITEMRVSEKYCPWIDKDLKALMQTRDKLKKAASKRKSQFLMDSYRQVRNKVNTMNSNIILTRFRPVKAT